MAAIDVIKCCLESIRQISEDIDDAVIFLDAGSTESFQIIGAFPVFLELGARAVCSLENSSALDKVVGWRSDSSHVKKIVVITSRLLSDAHRYILRCLNLLQSVVHCAIYTSISEVAHSAYPDSPLGPDAFHEYETLLKQDYEELVKNREREGNALGSSNISLDESSASDEEGWSHLTSLEEEDSGRQQDNVAVGGIVRLDLMVSVHHFPMLICPFSPRVFVLPSEGSIAEASLSTENENSVSSGLPPLSTGKPTDAEDIPATTLIAQFLYHFALKMDLKLEIFSLGNMSKHVGKLLTEMSSLYDVARRKRSVGLLIVDRTLDLLTPCCHGDSLLDRMLSVMPHRQRKASATASQMKGSQSLPKCGSVKLERSPISIKIPLENVVLQDDSKNNLKLLKNIEAFMRGWNSVSSNSENAEIKVTDHPNGEELSFSDELSGTFVCTDNFRGAPYLEAIMERRTKDAIMLIKKWLQESLRHEKISLDVRVRPGFPSKSELLSLVKFLAKRQSSVMKHKGLIQLASATTYILDDVYSTKWDAFVSAEKILRVNATDSSQSLSSQISDFMNKTALASSLVQKQGKSQGIFTLEDVLLLTVVGYILAGESFPNSGSGGPFSWQEEHFMKEALMDAVLENPTVSKLKFLHGISEELQSKLDKSQSGESKALSTHLDPGDDDDDHWGMWGDEDDDKDTKKDQAFGDMQLKLELRDRVNNLFKFFHKLSNTKRNAPLKDPLESTWNNDLYSSKGLISKLLTNILDSHDIPGLEYHSSTVGRLFKSGFGRLGLGQARPNLADQNVILIFVVGGINGVEVQEAMEAVAASNKPDIDLILGGTTFLTPNDMRELLLGDFCHI